MIAVTFWLFCLASSALAKPPVLVNYQDSAGEYSFSYSHPGSSRSEYRSADGLTRGSYSYTDRNGVVQSVEYEAGRDSGFQVKATNLPEPPRPIQDTPEVAAIREQHLQLLKEADKNENLKAQDKVESANPQPTSEFAILTKSKEEEAHRPNAYLPRDNYDIASRSQSDSVHLIPPPANIHDSVTYTPEVLAAREAHFRAYESAAKLAEEPTMQKQDLQEMASQSAQIMQQMLYQNQGSMQAAVQNTDYLPQRIMPEATMTQNDELRMGSAPQDAQRFESMAQNTQNAMLQNSQRTESMANNAQKMTSEMGTDTMPNQEAKKQFENRLASLDANNVYEQNNIGAPLAPVSTRYRIMDTRLPALNEFEQAKLKSGAYSTPIEISHIAPTNVIPLLYPSYLGSSAFHYVYL